MSSKSVRSNHTLVSNFGRTTTTTTGGVRRAAALCAGAVCRACVRRVCACGKRIRCAWCGVRVACGLARAAGGRKNMSS